MIETSRWLARLNSALCCQIESFFGGLGADMKGPSARTLSASKSSELKIGAAIKLGSPKAKANEVRAGAVRFWH